MRSPCQKSNTSSKSSLVRAHYYVQELRHYSEGDSWWDCVDSSPSGCYFDNEVTLLRFDSFKEAVEKAKAIRKKGSVLDLRVAKRTYLAEATDEVVWEERP